MLTVGWSWHLWKCGPGVIIWSNWLQESGWPPLDQTLSWHLHPPTSLCHFTCLASGGIRVWAPVYFSQAKAQIALVPLVEKQKTKHTCLLFSLNSQHFNAGRVVAELSMWVKSFCKSSVLYLWLRGLLYMWWKCIKISQWHQLTPVRWEGVSMWRWGFPGFTPLVGRSFVPLTSVPGTESHWYVLHCRRPETVW